MMIQKEIKGYCLCCSAKKSSVPAPTVPMVQCWKRDTFYVLRRACEPKEILAENSNMIPANECLPKSKRWIFPSTIRVIFLCKEDPGCHVLHSIPGLKVLYHLQKFFFCKNRNSQLPGFPFLRTGVFAHNNIGCLLGYGAGGLTAK